MTADYKKSTHMIDMSERLQVRIKAANDDEIEKNNQDFYKLNELIKTKLEENDRRINDDIQKILSEKASTDVELSHFIEIYDDISEYKDVDRIKNKSFFHELYSGGTEKADEKRQADIQFKKILLRKVILAITLFGFFAACKLADRLESQVSLIKIPAYLMGVIYIVSPILITVILYTIIRQILYIESKRRTVIWKAIVICVGVGFFGLNFNNASDLILAAHTINIAEGNKTNNSNTESKYQVYDSKDAEEENNHVIENSILKLDYADDFINSVAETYEAIDCEHFYIMSRPDNRVIAKDTISGKEYTEEQLLDQKLLIPYKDGGKEVVFYGQYNKNGHWEGICVFNAYEYDETAEEPVLTTITEANYDDGELISYKKAFRTVTSQGVDVWSISDRIVTDKYNSGETRNYFLKSDYLKNFDINNVEAKDIINIDDFEKKLKTVSTLEGYYCGNTLDGYYNDDTGNAYMVKFAEDGMVRTLYAGCFKNGYPDDETENAWQIVFDSSSNINRYFYYKGKFKNGNRKGRVTSDNYITLEEIRELIGGMTFGCELNWYDENK